MVLLVIFAPAATTCLMINKRSMAKLTCQANKSAPTQGIRLIAI